MRLTLRTLLAYLDNMLDPADAEVLRKKIEESKFASDLVARIRAVVKKRTGVPRLDAKGLGNDPNTVSDYLENLLPADRVPDFEKVCLESDAHLAEVAACHEILAMVLAKPAEFTPAIRERMYRVGARVAEAHARQKSAATESKGKSQPKGAAATVPAPHSSPAAARDGRDGRAAETRPAREQPTRPAEQPARNEPAPRSATREKPEVPDYLREARRTRLWPVLATVAFAFVLAVVLLRAIGPFDRTHPLARLVLGAGEPQIAQHDPATSGMQPAPPEQPTPEQPTPGQPGPSKQPGEFEPAPGPSEPAKIPPVDEPGEDLGTPAEPAPGEFVPEKPSPTERPSTERPVEPRPPLEPEPAEPVPAEPKPAEPAPAEAPPAKAVVVGRYISDQQVLARFDPATKEWTRLAVDTPLNSGDRLLVFPTYRPQLTLISGVQITVAGESLIELLPPDEDGVAHLHIEYGKLAINTSGKPGAQIGLEMGARHGLASFDDVDSGLAVEVRYYRYPGDFPDKITPTLVAELFPAGGSITWSESGGGTAKLAAGQILTYLNERPGTLADLGEVPDWVKGGAQHPVDRLASQTLAERLPVDRSLLLSLQERVEPSKETRLEVRSLAIRSLMQLDVFEPFVLALGDDRHKSYWTAQFDSVQQALARGPAPAEEVKKAFENQRPEDAASLYRVLIGYSQEELNRAGAAKLIEYLEHDSLDFRVLASESLLRITGKTLSYRPEVVASRRIQPVQRWKQEQKAGMLVYKSVPSPLIDRKGTTAMPTAAKEPAEEP